MSNLKEALISVDKSLNVLKQEVYKKKTLVIAEDEIVVYKSMNAKYSDIISLINYIGANQNELSKTNRKNTL